MERPEELILCWDYVSKAVRESIISQRNEHSSEPLTNGLQLKQTIGHSRSNIRLMLYISGGQLDKFAVLDHSHASIWRGTDLMAKVTVGKGTKRDPKTSGVPGLLNFISISKWKVIVAICSQLEIKVSFANDLIYVDGNNPEIVTGGGGLIVIYTTVINESTSSQIEIGKVRLQITDLAFDDWVSILAYDKKRKLIFAVSNNDVLIYDYITGKRTDSIRAVHDGTITCLVLWESEGVWITGSKDATIKVWTQQNNLVFELKDHSQTVTGLSIVTIMNKTFLLSSSLDCYIRLWDLETGISLYKGMYGSSFCTYSNEMGSTWSYNHIFSNFCLIENLKLKRVKQGSHPNRILAFDQSGFASILSSRTGGLLAQIDPLKNYVFVDNNYDSARGIIYQLVQSGRTLVYDVTSNPSKLIEEWTYSTFEDKVTCFTPLYHSMIQKYRKAINEPVCIAHICGTASGQIVSRDVHARGLQTFLAHTSAINSIALNIPTSRIVTSCLGQKVWALIVTEDVDKRGVKKMAGVEGIQILLALTPICTIKAPGLLSNLLNYEAAEGIFLTSTLERNILLFRPSKDNDTYTVTRMGTEEQEHTQSITGLAILGSFMIMASCSSDGNVKIWDMQLNTLIREILLNVPLYSIEFVNLRADLIVSLHSRIVMMQIQDYLPVVYLKMILECPVADDILETMTSFQESALTSKKVNRCNIWDELMDRLKTQLPKPLVTRPRQSSFSKKVVIHSDRWDDLKPTIIPAPIVEAISTIMAPDIQPIVKKSRIYDEIERDGPLKYDVPELNIAQLVNIRYTGSGSHLVPGSLDSISSEDPSDIKVAKPLLDAKDSRVTQTPKSQNKRMVTILQDKKIRKVLDADSKAHSELVQRKKKKKKKFDSSSDKQLPNAAGHLKDNGENLELLYARVRMIEKEQSEAAKMVKVDSDIDSDSNDFVFTSDVSLSDDELVEGQLGSPQKSQRVYKSYGRSIVNKDKYGTDISSDVLLPVEGNTSSKMNDKLSNGTKYPTEHNAREFEYINGDDEDIERLSRCGSNHASNSSLRLAGDEFENISGETVPRTVAANLKKIKIFSRQNLNSMNGDITSLGGTQEVRKYGLISLSDSDEGIQFEERKVKNVIITQDVGSSSEVLESDEGKMLGSDLEEMTQSGELKKQYRTQRKLSQLSSYHNKGPRVVKKVVLEAQAAPLPTEILKVKEWKFNNEDKDNNDSEVFTKVRKLVEKAKVGKDIAVKQPKGMTMMEMAVARQDASMKSFVSPSRHVESGLQYQRPQFSPDNRTYPERVFEDEDKEVLLFDYVATATEGNPDQSDDAPAVWKESENLESAPNDMRKEKMLDILVTQTQNYAKSVKVERNRTDSLGEKVPRKSRHEGEESTRGDTYESHRRTPRKLSDAKNDFPGPKSSIAANSMGLNDLIIFTGVTTSKGAEVELSVDIIVSLESFIQDESNEMISTALINSDASQMDILEAIITAKWFPPLSSSNLNIKSILDSLVNVMKNTKSNYTKLDSVICIRLVLDGFRSDMADFKQKIKTIVDDLIDSLDGAPSNIQVELIKIIGSSRVNNESVMLNLIVMLNSEDTLVMEAARDAIMNYGVYNRETLDDMMKKYQMVAGPRPSSVRKVHPLDMIKRQLIATQESLNSNKMDGILKWRREIDKRIQGSLFKRPDSSIITLISKI